MTIIWVVLPFYDYDGLEEPDGVFSSREKAQAFVDHMKSKHSGMRLIFECVLDAWRQTPDRPK